MRQLASGNALGVYVSGRPHAARCMLGRRSRYDDVKKTGAVRAVSSSSQHSDTHPAQQLYIGDVKVKSQGRPFIRCRAQKTIQKIEDGSNRPTKMAAKLYENSNSHRMVWKQ